MSNNLPSLYQLSREVSELLESDDETSLDALDALLPSLEHKASNVARWVQYQEDLAAAVKERETKVVAMRKAMEAKASRAREYLQACMEMADVYSLTDARTGTTIKLQKNPPKVVVDDETMIVAAFWTQPDPPPPVLNKKALAEALKAGEVYGAHLVQSMRLVIK